MMTDPLILPVDIPTLALSRGVMQMMLGGLLLYIGSRHADSPGARWWAIGFLLNGLSLFVFPLQVPAAWEQPRTIVNHLSVGASSICLLCGFWTFGRQPFRRGLLLLLIAMPLTSLIAFELLWPNARWRILLTAGSQAIFLLGLQHSLGSPRRVELAVIGQRLRVVVLLFLAVHLWSYGSLADVLPTTARLNLGYHRTIFSVASLLFMLSLAVGCLALQFALLAARSADLARIDWLTGLLNRRGFFHAAAQPAASDSARATLIALDIDHFKQINDCYGHAAGDQVLQRLANLMRQHARPDQLLARLGGEEFCLLDSSQSPINARQQAETLRQACAETTVRVGTDDVRFTISVGVHQQGPGQSLEQALARADGALYLAKRSGRNRVAVDELSTDGRHGATPVEE